MNFRKNKDNKQSNNISASPDTELFYQQSADWGYDLYHSQGVWLKRSLLLNTLLIFTLLVMSLVIFVLVPLKEKVPYLYTFDKATGEITKIGTLAPTQLTANWEMTRFFLIHYVMNRESYDYYNIEYPYQIAWAMSADDVRKQYDAEVDSNMPKSPYKLYKKDKYITVHVLSVSRLSSDTASVRFEKILHDRVADTQQISHMETIVKWRYVQPETTQKMLDRDPLGFKVTYYQATQIT